MKDALEMINDLKRDHKLTDENIAELFGISSSTIRRWRTGYEIPKWVALALAVFMRHSKRKIKLMIKERCI